jgi:hypothetical protein
VYHNLKTATERRSNIGLWKQLASDRAPIRFVGRGGRSPATRILRKENASRRLFQPALQTAVCRAW